jgi:hypothetical protein
MNVFGNLANQIYTYEFDSDPTVTSVTAISGWLESNLGLLNNMLYSSFSGVISGAETDIPLEAQNIHKEIYMYNYYSKQSRNALRGIMSSSASGDGSNILSVKDGESQVTFVNKNEVSKVYRGLSTDSKVNIDKLVAQYNIYGAEPRQLAGIESAWSGVYSSSAYNHNFIV